MGDLLLTVARLWLKIKPVSGSGGGQSPSAARALGTQEAEDLIAIAKALPPTWAVIIEPPHGQLAITPLRSRHRFHRCWVASLSLGRVTRDVGLTL